MVAGKDFRNKHFVISLAKSAVRLLGCVLCIMFDSVPVLAGSLMVAEVLGIVEEI